MSDLISRSALIEEIEKQKLGLSGNSELAYNLTLRIADIFCNIIRNQPTVEAKPVVHCKDCEHWGTGVAGETEHVKCCEYGKYMVGENGFCCYADMRKKVE